NVATAEEAGRASQIAVEGVSFADGPSLSSDGRPLFDFSLHEGDANRFASLAEETTSARRRADDLTRRYEISLAARGDALGLPVDVAVAQRAAIGVDEDGDVSRRGRGSELRLGQGLDVERMEAPDWFSSTWYFFAASDDEALTWRPGANNQGV